MESWPSPLASKACEPGGIVGHVASDVAGLLWDHAGHAAVFLFGAAFTAAGGIAMLLPIPNNRGSAGT